MATTTNDKTQGVTITVDGRWRCLSCARITDTTPVCAGAHDDGSPRCSKAVCERCASRCVRCQALLCADCYARSKEGALCVQCPPPVEGRQAYTARQRSRAAHDAAWRADADRTARTAAEAQQSVDDAMRRAEEIERQIDEMKARMRRRGTTP